MKRFLGRGLAVALLIGTAVACSQNAFETVGVTKSEAIVSGCQKVGDVAVDANTPDSKVSEELSDAARSKGANYVLVASDGARTGSAYRCGMPSASNSAAR